MSEYKHVKRYERPRDYIGKTWFDYYNSGFGQHRDSDCLARSNFICALEGLGGESETVIVVRENHWAVGWIEWIAIHESDKKSLLKADELCQKVEDYPVLNEEHFSELEHDEAQKIWENCYSVKERIAYIRKWRNQFEFYDYKDMIGCVRGKYFCGYDSDLIN